MNRDEIVKKVKTILADSLNVQETEITEEATMGNLGADSLDVVNAIMDVEKGFDIHLMDKEAEGIESVKQLIDLVVIHTANL